MDDLVFSKLGRCPDIEVPSAPLAFGHFGPFGQLISTGKRF